MRSWQLFLLLSSSVFSAYSSPALVPFTGIQRDSRCGETRLNLKDGDHGYFESPFYPKTYRGGLDCEYRYEGVPGTVIQATVFDLKTQNALLTDISDSVYVSLSGNWSDSQRFSGDLGPVTPLVLVSEGNALAIRFRSSQFSEGNRGFKIGYFVRASNTGKPAASEPAHDVYTVVVCNYLPVDHPQVWPEQGISFRAEGSQPDLEKVNRNNSNPFLVALVLDENQFCSGTLISDRHVVTSSHCTRSVKRIEMIFGAENLMLNDAGVQRRVVTASSVTQHPNFDSYTGENDISVITLDTPVEITRFVVPAALPTWSFMGTTFTGFKGEIAGWGDSSTGTVYSQVGKRAIRVSPNAACSITNRAHTGLSMCSRMSPGSTCQADSGSPIVASRAYCNGPVDQNNNGPNGINNAAQKPPRPQKPVKPGKPGRPNHQEFKLESPVVETPKYQANVLLGLVSHGSCDKGFSFTRITSQLDFLSRFLTLHSDS